MGLVYLDANVLVPSYPRTLLIMAAPLSDFTVVWSLHAEAEAERHQESEAAPISALRKRFVHPDLFLSRRLSAETYRDILGRLAKTRTREPKTAAEMHRIETGERLPLLAERMKDAYPVERASLLKGSPRTVFRGVRCVACGELLTDRVRSKLHLCPGCRSI